jgi:hypothetical protein
VAARVAERAHPGIYNRENGFHTPITVFLGRATPVARERNLEQPLPLGARRLRRYADTPIRPYADTPIRPYAHTPIRPYADTFPRRESAKPIQSCDIGSKARLYRLG